MRIVPAVLVLSLLAAQTGNAVAADGAKLVRQVCAACHATKANATSVVGPNLFGVVGRKAGTAPDYEYSPEMKASGLTWDAATLDKLLAGPNNLVKGTKMTLGPQSPEDRKAIIEFLATLK